MPYNRFISKTHPVTTTFADYAASAPTREQITENVLKHTLTLCEVLRQDYIQYSIKSHNRSIENGENVDYHIACIQDLGNGKSNYEFVIESGRKYHKIVMVIDNGPGRSPSRSCHAFVDKKTGGVFKSASWKAPAKGERFNLLNGGSRDHCYHLADWNGHYLYM